MPLIRIDIIEGHNDEFLQALLDGVHHAMVRAFEVPLRDRYQLLHEHKPGRFIMEDTGLDIHRTENRVLISVTSRPRSESAKLRFYRGVCEELQTRCGIKPSDIMISITSNSDSDWSFGWGRAQFLTGEL